MLRLLLLAATAAPPAAAPPSATAATLRPCNATHAKQQGWILRPGAAWGADNTLVMNTSVAQRRLPHCGFCLEVSGWHAPHEGPIVRKAPCCCGNGSWCGRDTCADPAGARDRQTFALRPDGLRRAFFPGVECSPKSRKHVERSEGCWSSILS